MDPMPEDCRRRVRLYAGNGILITEITNIKALDKKDARVDITTEDSMVVTLYGTIVVEENPFWRG